MFCGLFGGFIASLECFIVVYTVVVSVCVFFSGGSALVCALLNLTPSLGCFTWPEAIKDTSEATDTSPKSTILDVKLPMEWQLCH